MTLVEIAIAMPVLLVALGMFVQMLSAGIGLRETGREEWAASSAGQDVLERMRNEEFRTLFVLYNADPFDDPGGPGTAPGTGFSVPELTALDDDEDGLVGEVVLPTVNVGSEVAPDWQIREDLVHARLAMPRDVNGDAFIDDQDHSADYTLLPVLIRLRWRGRHGPRELRIQTILSELR